MSVIDTLVTDRTAADVIRWQTLRDKGIAGMTTDELAEWLAGIKGAYNATDLNRVGQAVAYLGGLLKGYGYSVTLTAKTDWVASGAYTAADLSAYLQDVKTLREALSSSMAPPDDMDGLTIDEANDIERVLIECDDALDRMAKSWFYSGEIGCGEV
ncbi:hypothetical protein OBV_18220 [Oscillibacter valericigenes Sjm18-20]|nr:hypothetical protein OBV_18220 [Oscillibacter valericigenes Sjm18-20]